MTAPTVSTTGTVTNPLGTLPFLLPFVVYVLHTLEELPGFAAWATPLQTRTTDTFAGYHIPLMLLVLLGSRRATAAGGRWMIAASAFQWQFAVNAVFHLGSWVILGEYSPGAVTAAVIALPATVFTSAGFTGTATSPPARSVCPWSSAP